MPSFRENDVSRNLVLARHVRTRGRGVFTRIQREWAGETKYPEAFGGATGMLVDLTIKGSLTVKDSGCWYGGDQTDYQGWEDSTKNKPFLFMAK